MVIGLVTALIALVRLLISGWSAVPTVFAGAGVAYLILLAGIGVVSLEFDPDLLKGPMAGKYRVTRLEALFFFTLAALWIWFFGIHRVALASRCDGLASRLPGRGALLPPVATNSACSGKGLSRLC